MSVGTGRFVAHETACIDAGADIGDGTRIWHFSHIRAGARIGTGCTLGQNVYVAASVVIGDRVKIQNNVSLYDGVVLDDDVFCGPSAVFTNVVTPRSHVSRRHAFVSTRVRRGATLGANCTIVAGVEVGAYAFVGAGAVVTRNVPAHALVIGNPARHVGWVCACGPKLCGRHPVHQVVVCAECGAEWRLAGDGRGLEAVAPAVLVAPGP